MIDGPLLVALGAGVGAYGTLIGAGGGFLLVPILLLLYPHDAPATVTTISLAVVTANAASGSGAYIRQRRVDYRTGLAFTLAAVPGAVLGALATAYLARGPFDVLLGALLGLLSVWLLLRPASDEHPHPFVLTRLTARTITDADGTTYAYRFDLSLGIGISFFVGFMSSLLGIGGGVIHVPVMVQVLGIPPHIATATSHCVLAFTALTGVGVHLAHGDGAGTLSRIIPLCLGVIVGAQAGARLSERLQGALIVRLLGAALAIVGLRLILGALPIFHP